MRNVFFFALLLMLFGGVLFINKAQAIRYGPCSAVSEIKDYNVFCSLDAGASSEYVVSADGDWSSSDESWGQASLCVINFNNSQETSCWWTTVGPNENRTFPKQFCGGTGCTRALLNIVLDVDRGSGTRAIFGEMYMDTAFLPPTAYIHCNGIDGSCGSIPFANGVNLDWGSQNADSCNVPGIGSSGPIGSGSTGALTSNQSYTVTCTGPGGSVSDTVTVYVGTNSTIGCNGAGNCSIPYNSTAVLTWSSGNATYCELYRNWAAINTNLPATGTFNTGALTQNWEYEIVCKNNNPDNPYSIGTTQVTVGPPTYGCTDPAAANYNSSANIDDGSCKYLVNLNFNVSGTCGPVAGATITIDRDFGNGTTRITDGSGFQNFGVYNNTVIGWTVSASGYTTQGGSVTSGNRGTTTTINVNLGNPSGGSGGEYFLYSGNGKLWRVVNNSLVMHKQQHRFGFSDWLDWTFRFAFSRGSNFKSNIYPDLHRT
ncbi:MAG: carboxypeptidase regulatory-like domain-containing protein [Candidatus Yanofskybacteria bacterium]|nr:carboxypeptidase regulatory-like domain-containing protein [Candidatus Yanofskybacteria bacterium]